MDSKLRLEIAKLVLMMTSNHDQEAIAAVRAIERKLVAANASMHDLADLIRGGREGGTSVAYRTCAARMPKQFVFVSRKRRSLHNASGCLWKTFIIG